MDFSGPGASLVDERFKMNTLRKAKKHLFINTGNIFKYILLLTSLKVTEMFKRKSVETIKETTTGRNIKFLDRTNGQEMTQPQFVKKIENGQYSGYHIRKINGIKTPVSNPDKSESNNLD